MCQGPVISVHTRPDLTTLRAGRGHEGEEKNKESKMPIQHGLLRMRASGSRPQGGGSLGQGEASHLSSLMLDPVELATSNRERVSK